MEYALKVLMGIQDDHQIEVGKVRNVTTESCTRTLNVRRPDGQLVDSYDLNINNALIGGHGSVTWTRTSGTGEGSIPVQAQEKPFWGDS